MGFRVDAAVREDRSSGARLGFVGLLALMLMSCANGVTVPALVAGPFSETPPWELFEQLLAGAREAGYEPVMADLDAGTFRVAPHVSHGQPDTWFLTRCFRGGWVQVTPRGPGLRPEGAVSRVPPELRRELVAYFNALRRHAETR